MTRRRRTGQRKPLWRKLAAGAVLAAAAFVVLANMTEGQTPLDISKRPDNMPTQPGWTTPLHNPVLPAGSLRRQALWNDPTLLKEGGTYVMYMTTSIKEPFKPPIVPFRATSPDGVTWKLDPPTPVAVPDGTRFVNIETPSVVKFHGEYHMYFSGIYPNARPALMAVGHAVSPDGIAWKVSPGPVISETGRPQDWNGVLVGEPGAIVRGDEIFVYFSAVGARATGVPPQDQSIGLAITRDGEHFGPSKRVLAQSATYPAERGFAGYSTPSPFELNGQVHLLYDVALSLKEAKPDWQQVALHHARSTTDGKGEFIQDERPIFTRNSFPWTLGEVIGPSALVDDGQVKIWFGGHVPVSDLGPLIRRDFSGDEFGINYATRPVADFK